MMPELTPAERKLARMLACGMSSRQISQKQGRTFHGVKEAGRRLYIKCGMSNRVEFALLYWKSFPDELKSLAL